MLAPIDLQRADIPAKISLTVLEYRYSKDQCCNAGKAPSILKSGIS
jgi:hypothetical protein